MSSATLSPQTSGLARACVSDLSFVQADRDIARKLVIFGYIVAALFVTAIFSWAFLVPISSAAIAPGVVSKEGYRKTIQHLEGGIIQKIWVADGDTVTAGQILIELADLQSRSQFNLLQKQTHIAMAKEASLRAAQTGSSEVQLPDSLDLEQLEPAVRDAISGQIDASIIAGQLHRQRLEIVDKQIMRTREKILALREEQAVLLRSKALVDEELAEYLRLQEDGLVTRKLTFELKRQVVDNDLAYSANRVQIQSAEQEISDLEMEQSTLEESHWNRIGGELEVIRELMVQLDEKLSQTEDTLERTIIRAGISGVVVNLQVNTVGGVISSGQPLMDIVPSAGKLLVNAKVNPMDRDTVQVGQIAEVRFSAFNRRLTKPVRGRVKVISADRVLDEVTAETYYQAKIELLDDPDSVLAGGQVYPGMLAEVYIITGTRTALSYLTAPFTQSFGRAFREE